MCGRFFFDGEDWIDLFRLMNEEERRKIKQGEIFPTNEVPIIRANGEVCRMKWGFNESWSKRELINARSESVLEKKTFRESFLSRRCVIPTSGFYEWDRNEIDEKGKKTKYLFHPSGTARCFLGGIWRKSEDVDCFVILTTKANASMDIHDRMPIILEEKDLEKWVMKSEFAIQWTQRPQAQLVKNRVSESVSGV